MSKKWLILAVMFLFLIPSVMAIQPTHQFNQLFLNPFVLPAMTNNQNYSFLVNVNPPDGLSSVKSAIINFDIYMTPSVNFTVMVNGTLCNTKFFYVSTTYAGAGQGRIKFDCSNRITKAGTYNVTIRPTGANTGSTNGWLDLTYMNNPNAEITIHGTEYIIGDNGKIWLQLINASGFEVNNAVCLVDIYYPDNSVFMENSEMNFLEEGVYYFDFTVPNTIGVYPTIADCYYTTVTQTETADAGTIWIGTNVQNDYTATRVDDNSYWKIDEALSGGQYRIDYVLNFTGITPPSSLNSLTIDWLGKWTGTTGDELFFYIWNYTNSSWFELPNSVTNTGGAFLEVTNTISTTNLTASGLINASQIQIRIRDYTLANDVSKSEVHNDYIAIKLNYFTNPEWQETKGSSEIHVSSAGSNPFLIMETLCDDESSDCSYFTNDGEFDFPEGEIEDNITIFALTNLPDIETKWIYESPYSVDCTALYWVVFWNGTAWADITDTTTLSSTSTAETCKMTIPITLNPNGVAQAEYYYRVKFDNYLVWEVDYTDDIIHNINDTIYEYCQNLATQYNYTFIVPIPEGINKSVPSELFDCERTFDDMYWWDLYYADSKEITVVGDYFGYLAEAKWYRDILLRKLSTGIFTSSMDIHNMTMALGLKYVGGTEYITEQTGSISAQFITGTTPILTGTCLANITYPNRTIFITNANMTLIPNSNAVYQYNFTVPSTEGVYITDIKCSRTTPSTTAFTSGTFHVSNSLYSNLSSVLNYLMVINGTTFQINESLYNDYLSLLTAINSVNSTANQTLSYVIALNGSVFNLSIAELSHFNQLLALLNSINYTLNTTLEYKLDLINGTVFQINQSQTAYYLSLLGAIESVGATLNGSITQYLVAINGTTYNLSVNEYNHYVSILQAINSANDTQNWQYLNLLSLLNDINATGNTTLTLVASINQTLWDDIFVILKDINFTTNTTLEYKLDLINYTTWQSWIMLQNLTVGNVSVTANVNWTEGVPIIWNASGQSQINYSLLSLSQEGIQLVVETLTCVSNTTLIHTMNVTNCVMGQCLDSVKNITESCAYGCANNMCVPAPTIQYFSILGVILLIAGVTYVIWKAGGKG